MVTTCMEIEITQPTEDWITLIKKLRNDIIGSNTRKEKALVYVPKLIEFLCDDSSPIELKIESAVILGSLAKGTQEHVQFLFDNEVLQILLRCVGSEDLKLTESIISCIRSIVCRIESAKDDVFKEPDNVARLVSLIMRSPCCQECVAVVFARSCRTADHQLCLFKHGAISSLVQLISSNSYRVQISALRCISVLAHHNVEVSHGLANCVVENQSVVDFLLKLQQRDNTVEMQLCAAKCLSCLCRANVEECKKPAITLKILATLIFVCQPDKMWVHRCEGADCLAYLTENDVYLQDVASISGQILAALSDYFNYAINNFDSKMADVYSGSTMLADLNEQNLTNELRKVAFKAYSSLAANSEDVRKKVLESASVMQYIVDGLTDSSSGVQCAALRCLVSLSRSVHQLRTSFHDKKIWKLVFDIFMSSTDEHLLNVCTALLCNLLLEFSPSKELILNEREVMATEYGPVERHSVVVMKLLKLTRNENYSLKLNSIWCFMNMTFGWSDKEKETLLHSLRNDDIFHLIRSDNFDIVMKTLGTIRNLISVESHTVDCVMERIGRKVMESVVLVLEGDFQPEIKEQALCILVNISSGKTSKNFIMENQDVLRKIMNYLVHDCEKLQLAANDCIFNLVRRGHEGLPCPGYLERQKVFKEHKLQDVLQLLQKSNNSSLCERTRQTLEEF